MKKIFSAILLMAAMAFSVSTFVSCNDLATEIEGVTVTAGENTEAIKKLNEQIATLETALSKANDAAKKAQETADQAVKDAAAAAAAAKTNAEALKALADEAKALKEAYEKAIADINADLAGKVSKEEMEKAIADAVKAASDAADLIYVKAADLDEALAAKVDKSVYESKIAELVKADADINNDLKTLKEFMTAMNSYKESNDKALEALADSVGTVAADLLEAKAEILELINDPDKGLEALYGLITAHNEDYTTFYNQVLGDNSFSLKSRIAIAEENINSLMGRLDLAEGRLDSAEARILALENLIKVGPLAIEGRLATAEENINSIMGRVDTAENDILAINENLNTVKSMINDLANQIQSVAFVPVNGENAIDVYSPFVGEAAETDGKFVVATYEVSPKGTVAGLQDNENVRLQFSTVETKVAAAEYFDANIIEIDAITGRMVVMGVLPVNAKPEAIALNITDAKLYPTEDEDGLPGSSIDAGTNIASAYVKVAEVQGVNVANSLVFKYDSLNEEKGEVETLYENRYDNRVSVPYTDANSLRELISIDGIYVEFDDYHFSLEQVETYMGLELDVDYGEPVYKYLYSFNKDNTPIIVEGEDLSYTGKIVPNSTFSNEKLVGKSVTITIEDITVNEVETDLYAYGKYSILKAVSDNKVVIDAYSIDWSYKSPVSFAQKFTQPYPELKVALPAGVTLNDLGSFSPIQLEAEVEGEDGEPITKKITVKVVKMASNILGITEITGNTWPVTPAEYLEEEVTYVANGKFFTDSKNKIDYPVEFSVNVAAKPEAKTINLGTFPVPAYLNNPVSIFAEKFENAASSFLNDPLYDEYKKDFPGEAFGNALSNEYLVRVADKCNTTDGAKLELQAGIADADASIITIDGIEEVDAEYEIEEVYTFFGTEYTFVATVQFEQMTGLEIEPNNLYVKDGASVLSGTVVDDIYVLDELHLIDYVAVDKYTDAVKTALLGDEALGLKPEAKLVYECLDNDKDLNGDYIYDVVEFDGDKVKFINKDLKTYNFKISLVSIVDETVVYDSFTVAASVADLIKMEVTGDKTGTYKNGAGSTTVNIADKIKLTNLAKNNTVVIYNKDAKNLEELTAGKFGIYEQKVVADTEAVAYLGTVAEANKLDKKYYTVDAKGNSYSQLLWYNSSNRPLT